MSTVDSRRPAGAAERPALLLAARSQPQIAALEVRARESTNDLRAAVHAGRCATERVVAGDQIPVAEDRARRPANEIHMGLELLAGGNARRKLAIDERRELVKRSLLAAFQNRVA